MVFKKMSLKMRGCAMLAAVALLPASSVQAKPSGPVVQTVNGAVEGFYNGETAQFLGLPFAAPPVGPLRWRPPVEPANWQGVRSARQVGPQCAQIFTAAGFAGPPNNNEDCLYLNIFAPRRAATGKTRLPVFVWIHGGANANGSGNDYDGTKLAVMGGAIVVTINYRLNHFGFMAHPAIDKEGHPFANYGLLDQQAALRWVQANIAQFGGDPNNVTLGGQSAGGSNTGSNMTSPLARGLFHKAIIVSGGSYLSPVSLEQAQAKGVAFAKAAGCGEGAEEATAACLRALPAEAISKLAGSAMGNSPLLSGVVRDGQIVPTGAASAFAEDRFSKMPVINGNVRDEGGYFTAIEIYGDGSPPWNTITHDSVERMVRGIYGPHADRILAAYPASRFTTAQWRSNTIQSDAFVCKSRRATHLLSGKVPLYVYEFRDRTAPTFVPDMTGYEGGAYHTAELLYLFPGFHGTGIKKELNTRQRRLSDNMIRLFMNFARTGNPNGTGSKTWPAYDGKATDYIAFNTNGLGKISDEQFATEHQCALWANILTYN